MKIQIDKNMIGDVSEYSFDWDKSYVKEPVRTIGKIEGKMDFEPFPIPKNWIYDTETQKESSAYVEFISDTTLAFLVEALFNILFNLKIHYNITENDKIIYDWHYETIQERVPLPHDNRPLYEKGKVVVNYNIVKNSKTP